MLPGRNARAPKPPRKQLMQEGRLSLEQLLRTKITATTNRGVIDKAIRSFGRLMKSQGQQVPWALVKRIAAKFERKPRTVRLALESTRAKVEPAPRAAVQKRASQSPTRFTTGAKRVIDKFDFPAIGRSVENFLENAGERRHSRIPQPFRNSRKRLKT